MTKMQDINREHLFVKYFLVLAVSSSRASQKLSEKFSKKQFEEVLF